VNLGAVILEEAEIRNSTDAEARSNGLVAIYVDVYENEGF
jgi:hypothetical protein